MGFVTTLCRKQRRLRHDYFTLKPAPRQDRSRSAAASSSLATMKNRQPATLKRSYYSVRRAQSYRNADVVVALRGSRVKPQRPGPSRSERKLFMDIFNHSPSSWLTKDFVTFQNPEIFPTVIGGSTDFEFPGPATNHESSLSFNHGVLAALNTQSGRQNGLQQIRCRFLRTG